MAASLQFSVLYLLFYIGCISSMPNNHLSADIDEIPTSTNPANPTKTSNDYGVFISIRFDEKLNINDSTNIIPIIQRITNELIINNTLLIPMDCIHFDDLNIESQNMYNKTIVNVSIFVCNEQQQKQLVSAFNTNEYIISHLIVNEINQEYGLYVFLNSTHLETDTIVKYEEKEDEEYITTMNNANNGFYEKDSNDYQISIMFIIVVGTFALIGFFIVCIIFALQCIKIRLQSKAENEINRRNIETSIFDEDNTATNRCLSPPPQLTIVREPGRRSTNKVSVLSEDEQIMSVDVMCDVEHDDEVFGSVSADGMVTEGNDIVRPYIIDSVSDTIETLQFPTYARWR